MLALDWEMSRAEVAPANFRNSLRFKKFSRCNEIIFEGAVSLSARVRFMSRRQTSAESGITYFYILIKLFDTFWTKKSGQVCSWLIKP